MPSTSFHNSIHEQGQVLIDFEAAAENQEDLILDVFKATKKPMAWFEVRQHMWFEMNECSLKRSLTNLCSEKRNSKDELIRSQKLLKTAIKVMGPHGKNCYRYSLVG